MKLLSTLFLLFLSTIAIAGVNYSGPESVAYDAATNTYFVANTNGFITQQVPGDALTIFTSATTSPYGIEVMNGVVYVCDNGRVKGYSIADGTEVFNLNIGGSFLNGIDSDGDNLLFVTDFSANTIFKINVSSNTYSTFVSSTSSTPNGIYYDGEANRLVYVSWGGSAQIHAVSLSDSTESTLTSTSLGNMDGIDRDCMGNWYVSSWTPSNRVTRFSADFSTETTLINSGLNNPADIFFNASTDELIIPNTGSNSVDYEDVTVDRGTLMEPSNPLIEQLLTNGTSDQVILTFNLDYPCGSNTLTSLSVASNNDFASNLSNFRLVRSSDNSYATAGDNTELGAGTIGMSSIEFTGLSGAVSDSKSWYFVIADVASTVDESAYGDFRLSSANIGMMNETVFGDNEVSSNIINFNNATSIKPDLQYKVMDAYPNPFQDNFKIQLPEGVTEMNVVITNILGKAILTMPVTKSAVISTKEWATGVYFVQAPSNSDIHTLRIIKR